MPISPFLGRSKSLVSDPKEALPRASTSSIFPTLHKLNTGPPNTRRPVSQPTGASSSTANNGPPTPLVSLRLSGPSFLDVVIRDRADKEPVYIIETVSDSTLIYRLDTTTDNAHKVATVQWPNSVIKSKTKSGRTIQMADGRWRDAEDLLKLGPLGSVATRKFSIPHYPHQMKWKLIPGGHFYCTTAGANGPFAVLDSAVLNAPARLSVFHNCLEDNETRHQENYKGVPVMLLDYLVVTAMLLGTDVQEWLDRPQNVDGTVRIPGSSAHSVQKWLAIIHNEPLPASPVSPAETTASGVWTLADRRISNATTSSGPRSAATSDFSSMPSTPATSVHSAFFSYGQEEIPPVPPLPDLSRYSHQEMQPPDALYRNSYSQGSTPSLLPPSPPPQQTSSRPTTLQQPPPRPSRLGRQLPVPPVKQPPPSSQRPTTPGQSGEGLRSTATDIPASSTSPAVSGLPILERARSPSPSMTSSMSSGSAGSRRSFYRNSARSSLARNAMPPPMPPPADTLPLPPKLAQEYQASTSRRVSSAHYSSPLGQSSSALQPANPDPLNDEDDERLRQGSEMASNDRQSSQPPLSQLGSPPELYPSPQQSPPSSFSPPVANFARLQMTDSGPVRMRDAMARQSYAETIYEIPPPAYDAIDFSASHVSLHQRTGGR